MFRSGFRQFVRFRTLVARVTLVASGTLAVAIGVANAQQPQVPSLEQQSVVSPQLQPGGQPAQGMVSGSPMSAQAALVAAPTVLNSTSSGGLCAGQIPGVPESHCGHVIDLLIRNRMRQHSGAVGGELAPGLLLSRAPSAPHFGDLELVKVHLVADGGPGTGPVIQVVVRNNSAIAVGRFEISIVGVLGQIHALCPTTRGTVTQIPAGAVAPFELQLPASAMSMGFQGMPEAPFDIIVVAIDSFDELMEANELNNVRIIRRVELLPLTPPAAAEITVPAVTPAVSEATEPADVAIPSPTQPVSPLDSFQFEDLQLESATPTAVGMTEFFRESGK